MGSVYMQMDAWVKETTELSAYETALHAASVRTKAAVTSAEQIAAASGLAAGAAASGTKKAKTAAYPSGFTYDPYTGTMIAAPAPSQYAHVPAVAEAQRLQREADLYRTSFSSIVSHTMAMVLASRIASYPIATLAGVTAARISPGGNLAAWKTVSAQELVNRGKYFDAVVIGMSETVKEMNALLDRLTAPEDDFDL
jgi:hypothetical protein